MCLYLPKITEMKTIYQCITIREMMDLKMRLRISRESNSEELRARYKKSLNIHINRKAGLRINEYLKEVNKYHAVTKALFKLNNLVPKISLFNICALRNLEFRRVIYFQDLTAINLHLKRYSNQFHNDERVMESFKYNYNRNSYGD